MSTLPGANQAEISEVSIENIYFRIIAILALVLLIGVFVYSHSGRTDKYGGHPDRKNGGYHYHNSRTGVEEADSFFAKRKHFKDNEEATNKISIPHSDRYFPVHVNITCDDKTAMNLIESNIKRELRDLKDVRICDDSDKSLYSIHIIALTYVNTYTFAVMMLQKHNSHFDIMMALIDYRTSILPEEKPVSDENFTKISEYSDKHKSISYYFPRLSLYDNVEKKDLQITCQEIVSDFDIELLEPIRQIFRDNK